ncbi:MAG: YhfC family glutamic-type intramembrane protease [Anaerolineaceae bacterium]|nr:YhfC family glutamic-type intramembrane protease [Anaerolineaceae bacterium]
MTINWGLVFTNVLAIVVEIGLPVTLGILAVKRGKVSIWIIVTGVLTFIGSQVVHLPLMAGINLLFINRIVPMPFAAVLPWFNAITAGVLAGLCEETARLVGFKVLKEKAQPFNSGLALGIGHGGLESVIVGFVVLFTFISNLLSTSALTTMTFWSAPITTPLAGAVERISAVSAHLFMSVLVWKAVANRNYLWYLLAFGYHAVLDAVTVFMSQSGFSMWAIEGVLTVFMLVSVFFLWRFWITERAKEKAAAELEPVPAME